MIKLNQSQTAIRWFALAAGLILATDITVILNIPVLRQVFGVVFVAILPGLLFLLLLKLNKLGLAEKAVLTIGLSAAFLMLFGWLVNQASVGIGYMTPLSSNSVILWLSLAYIILLVIAYFRNREGFSATLFHIKLNNKDKLCLLLPTILPLLSILGMYQLTTSGDNIILLITLFLIPLSIILLTVFHRHLSSDVFPIAVVMVSLSLLTMSWLRSKHILGNDAHVEYWLFYLTNADARWSIVGTNILSSSLGVTLLPAIFQSVLKVNEAGLESLFRGVFVLICSFAPLSVFVISRRYVGELYAFLAALFFAFQVVYLGAPGSPRTNLAIFFFALSLLVLFHQEIRGAQQKGLLFTFVAATIVSHYATSYIFLFLLLFAWLVGLILRNRLPLRKITPAFAFLSIAITFLWYSQISEVPFAAGVEFIYKTIINLGRFFIEGARSPEIAALLGSGFEQKIFLSKINYAVTYATFFFIAVGVIGTLIQRNKMIASSVLKNETSGFLRTKFDVEYFLMALFCCASLVAMVVIPFVSIDYDIQRVYSQVAVILSTFFVTGGVMITRYIRLRPQLMILLVLVPYFLFTTSVAYEVAGIHSSMRLSSKSPAIPYAMVQEQEIKAARWLKEYGDTKYRINVTDIHSSRKLVSQGRIPRGQIARSSFVMRPELYGYIYLSYSNVALGKIAEGDVIYELSDYSDMFADKKKLYTNGGSEIWQ